MNSNSNPSAQSSNSSMIERVKYLIDESGLTQGQFAKRIETDASNLSKHLTGRLPISDALINRIAINLGVSRSWLKDGIDLPYAKPTVVQPEITIDDNAIRPTAHGTPVYDIDVTAGPLTRSVMFADEHIIGRIDMPSIPADCQIVSVSGDSMDPVIHNGDLIAVRGLSNMKNLFWGQIYMLLLPDYRLVKYVRRHPDPAMLILHSENHNYDDMEVDRTDVLDIMLVHNIIHIANRI